jgi:hypothetical protein
MEITDVMRDEVLKRAGRRCECVSGQCRHHREGGRCPRGLRARVEDLLQDGICRGLALEPRSVVPGLFQEQLRMRIQ